MQSITSDDRCRSIMLEKTVTIRNRDGIHCRPSSAILTAVAGFPDCHFEVTCAQGDFPLDSILTLLSLGLQKGDEVTVRVEGGDEATALERIAGLFEFEFDFPPRQ